MRIATLGLPALITLMAVTSAGAADLGGNCCADLEERVAELEATTARKGNRKVSLQVSGHINEAILFHDLSKDYTDVEEVSIIGNNPLSQSRFRFKGEGKINADWSAGFLMEIGLSDGTLIERHQAVYIKSKTVGAVWLGLTSTATDGIAEIDLSGSDGLGQSPLNLSPAINVFAPGVSTFLPSFDGGRRDLVKWTSPEEAPLILSASISDKDNYDIALRYAGEFGGIRVAAGVGYRQDQQSIFFFDVDKKTIAGSASIHHLKSGLFLNGSAGRIEIEGEDLDGYHVKGGVIVPTSVGSAVAFGEYGLLKVDGEEGQYIGGGVTLNVDAAAMKLYLTGRQYDTGNLLPGFDEKPVVVIGGVKISF